MHLVRTEFMVRPGGAAEFEEAISRLGALRKGMPGYLGQALLHSYSYPGKYTVTSRWENVEAAWAFMKGEPFAGFAKSLPAGSLNLTGLEGYESVFEVDADGAQASPGTCEVLADWTLDQRPGVAVEFERTRKELFEIRKRHVKGFASNRLRRAAGTPGRYLILQMYNMVDDARAAQGVPEVQAFGAAHPYTSYASTPPNIEAYYVVHRM